MKVAFLLIGGNLGDKEKNLQIVSNEIELHIGTIIKKSSVYETEAWGTDELQPNYLNQIVVIKTALLPLQLLEKALKIELFLGRIRTTKNAPRTMDIDILFYENEIISLPQLIIPHPKIIERNFVMTPLNEIAPLFFHPIYKKTIQELYNRCTDDKWVKKRDFKY